MNKYGHINCEKDKLDTRKTCRKQQEQKPRSSGKLPVTDTILNLNQVLIFTFHLIHHKKKVIHNTSLNMLNIKQIIFYKFLLQKGRCTKI